MSRLSLGVGAVVATLGSAGLSQPIAGPEKVLTRALGQAPTREVVAFVAAYTQPTKYDAKHRPDLAGLSLDEAIVSHCGSLQDGYKEALAQANAEALPPSSQPLGSTAYRLNWPSCLHVREQADLTYRVKKDDTLTDIREKFTGSGLFERSQLKSFSNVSLSRAEELIPGEKIKVSFATAPTIVSPRGISTAQFVNSLSAIGGSKVLATSDIEAPGEVVGPVHFRNPGDPIGSLQGTFEPCTAGNAADGYPYKANEVRDAYSWASQATSAAVGRVTVVVVDNGFFGVPCDGLNCPKMTGDQVAESERFPRRLFDTTQFDARSGMGPVSANIYPLNYWNRKDENAFFGPGDVNEDSGHGTHVAGLVLGGPLFLPFQQSFVASDNRSWLRLVIANLANGRRVLLPGTDESLGDILGQIEGAKIVNMSVAFNARPGTRIGNTVRDAILGDQQSLFVVAAGNDGGSLNDDDHDLYPANLGGTENPNVVTVASVDAPAGGTVRLSKFSNRSGTLVDIAAPGCRLQSWIDGDRPAVEISGTSQATPLVSFAAALLNSLWQNTPRKLKNRLLYSGDLLDHPDDRAVVRSGARLNVAKALTYTIDRVTFRRNGSVRTLLGKLHAIQNLACEQGKIAPENLRGLKRAEDGRVLFYRTRNSGQLEICWGSFDGDTTLSFEPHAEVRNGTITVAGPLTGPILASETLDIVMRQ